MKLSACDICHRAIAWVNTLTTTMRNDKGEARFVEYRACAECFDKYGPVHRFHSGGRNVGKEPSPWLENAVRDLEEDR